jgi:DNA excision repair protein ERCC-6-like 2
VVNSFIQVFLISTRAGNLGVNLVSANRVVIFDPSWNPAQDLQAQDRSFRYGQRRHVTVFRLLGAGSLEELVYSRQIYKQQLSNIAVSGKIEKRYFEGVQVILTIEVFYKIEWRT